MSADLNWPEDDEQPDDQRPYRGIPQHPCAVCGAPTPFRRCDECFWADRGGNERHRRERAQQRQTQQRQRGLRGWWGGDGPQEQPLPPLPSLPASELQRIQAAETASADIFERWVWSGWKRRVERGAIGGADDGDEFARTLRAVAAAPTVVPQLRSWWGMCPWCARELRERCDSDESYLPATPATLARIRFCERHRAALFRWTKARRRDQEAEELLRLFTTAYGFGDERKGETA